MKRMKIYIIDDHKLFAEGLSSLLVDDLEFDVIGYSLSASDYLSIADKINADIFLVDINMPDMSGIQLTRKIKQIQPKAKILALTMFGTFEFVEKMIKNGASGYILKTISHEELIRAIRTVAKGEIFFGNDIQKIIYNEIGGIEKMLDKGFHSNSDSPSLTNREKEILALIAKEYTTEQIAEKLFISERTVETHRKNIFSKTGAKSVVGLIRYAVQNGITTY